MGDRHPGLSVPKVIKSTNLYLSIIELWKYFLINFLIICSQNYDRYYF